MPWHRRRKVALENGRKLRERGEDEPAGNQKLDRPANLDIDRQERTSRTSEIIQQLRPITSFAHIGLDGSQVTDVLPAAHQENIINNSTVIEILVHLLCREREADPAKRELLFKAISKVVEQCNSSLYLPLHSVPQLQDFRANLLGKFEILFEQVQTQFTTNRSIQHPPNPLAQLALTSPTRLDDRYTREFEEVSVLGKGGFGLVTKVRHRLDGRLYAVKIIPIRKNDLKTLNTLLREAQSLAGLDHPHIVRYHSTWTQFYCRPGGKGQHLSGSTEDNTSDLSVLSSRSHVPSLVSKPCIKIKELPSRSEEESAEFSDGIEFRDESTSEGEVNLKSQIQFNQKITRLEKCWRMSHEQDDSECANSSVISHQTTEHFSMFNHFHSYIQELKSLKATSSEEPLPSLMTCNELRMGGTADFSGLCGSDVSEISVDTSGDTDKSVDFTSVSQLSSSAGCKNSVVVYHPFRAGRQRRKKSNIAEMTLFIQMGLCRESLHEWLMKRNTSPEGRAISLVDANQCLLFFKQILQAVEYIHSNNIIHRDIKPANIFLSQDRTTLQLGDFGLARPLPEKVLFEDPPSSMIPNQPSLTPISEFAHNTSGVGTPIYAAPELKAGGSYGTKSDMHNLGIILLELFQPFQTMSERIHTIEALKKERVVDKEILYQWPETASWILKLTESDPQKRPSASDVLTSSLYTSTPSVDGRMHADCVEKDDPQATLNTSLSGYRITAEIVDQSGLLGQHVQYQLHSEESCTLSFGAVNHSRQQSPQDNETSQAIARLREEKSALMEQVAKLQRQIEKLEADRAKRN